MQFAAQHDRSNTMSVIIQAPVDPVAGVLNTLIMFLIIGLIIFAIVKASKRSKTQTRSPDSLAYQKQAGFRLHLVNPTNGLRKETIPFLWTFIFGGFYFIAHGIWTHALISLLLAIPTFGISWLFYPFFAKSIVLNYYLKMGWVEESEYQRMINQSIAPSTWVGARPSEQKQSQSTQVIKVRCTKCGSLNNESSKFCANCGSTLIQQSATT
jgi:hypothetical protein